MDTMTIESWSRAEFGGARLGDARLDSRLVRIGAGMARRPSGRITQVFNSSAEREAAYRFMSNPAVKSKAIGSASSGATLRRVGHLSFLFVPIDGSSLALTDGVGDKGFGIVGARKHKAPGLQVMTAMAVAPDGAPEGLLWQHFWARTKRSTRRREKADRRAHEEKETRYWNDAMAAVRAARDREGVATTLWFQLDRGGDAGEVLFDGLGDTDLFTVRAAYNRRLADDPDATRQYLRTKVESAPEMGVYQLAVPSRPKRKARTARMVVRTASVTIRLQDSRGRRVREVEATAVLAREEGTTPDGEKPIDWLLLTNAQVPDFDSATLVLFGYVTRWRIEEFHKAWKSGVCNTEATLLRSTDAVERLARITAAVAMRVLRLSYLARNAPDRPATVELNETELMALILLAVRNRYVKATPPRHEVTIAQAVDWIARIGGYTGKSSGGPPGFITINRGLVRFEPFVAGFAAAAEM